MRAKYNSGIQGGCCAFTNTVFVKIYSTQYNNKMVHIPESDCQWEDIDECIDLEDTEEKDSEMLKGLGEEVPEQTKVGGLVWNRKTANVCNNIVGSIHDIVCVL